MVTAVEGSRVTIDALEQFCLRILTSTGVCEKDAQTTTAALVMTDSWGVFTHGTKLLRGYVRRLRGGGLRADVAPEIATEGPAWAVVDGQSALGQVTTTFATEVAMKKAEQFGVGFVTVRNSCHFGAAGYYAWLAARAGMIGMAMANDVPSVAAPGSRGPVLGSNPIAFAFPGGEADPFLLDMSIATVAGGKVYARCKRGEPIPAGWLVDDQGHPTHDGSLYPDRASLAPAAGHKGYGIGLFIEILSGVLSGAAVTKQVGSWLFSDMSLPTNHGAAILVINAGAMMDSAIFDRRMADLVGEIHAAPTAEGAPPLMIPGEIEWRNRRRACAEGIALPEDVLNHLKDTAAECGQPFLL
ncbi:MAG TPA: Ldh family oxidoreductase [Lacipirellulaceae bacterium]|nr:Ldh family oxidoreductase [Lacipirellulaceae bacterium]